MRSYARLAVITFLGVAAVTATAASSARAEEACPLAASGTPMTAAQVKQSLIGKGYVTVRGLHLSGGCYQAFTIDKAGNRAEVLVDAASGQIVTNEAGGQ